MIDEFILKTSKTALLKKYEICQIRIEPIDPWKIITIYVKNGDMEILTRIDYQGKDLTMEKVMGSVRFKEIEWKQWFERGGHGIFGVGHDTVHRFVRWADEQIRLRYDLTATIGEVQNSVGAKETDTMSDLDIYRFIMKNIEEKYTKETLLAHQIERKNPSIIQTEQKQNFF